MSCGYFCSTRAGDRVRLNAAKKSPQNSFAQTERWKNIFRSIDGASFHVNHAPLS